MRKEKRNLHSAINNKELRPGINHMLVHQDIDELSDSGAFSNLQRKASLTSKEKLETAAVMSLLVAIIPGTCSVALT